MSTHDLKFCADCMESIGNYHYGHCVICEKDDRPLVHKAVPACLHCIKDTAAQQHVVRALGRGWTDRRRENADRLRKIKRGEIPSIQEDFDAETAHR